MTDVFLKTVTCRCDAYPFRHRQDSPECRKLYNSAHEAGYEKTKNIFTSNTFPTRGLK